MSHSINKKLDRDIELCKLTPLIQSEMLGPGSLGLPFPNNLFILVRNFLTTTDDNQIKTTVFLKRLMLSRVKSRIVENTKLPTYFMPKMLTIVETRKTKEI